MKTDNEIFDRHPTPWDWEANVYDHAIVVFDSNNKPVDPEYWDNFEDEDYLKKLQRMREFIEMVNSRDKLMN